MHAFGPPHAHFLLHGSAREIEPRFAEIVTKAVRSGRPDHDGCGIGDRLEPNLTLKQAFFSALSFSDVAIYRVIRNLLARGGGDWNREKRHMNIIPILAPTHRFDLYSVAGLESAVVLSGALNQSLRNHEIVNGTF